MIVRWKLCRIMTLNKARKFLLYFKVVLEALNKSIFLGAGFIDNVNDLSNESSSLPLMLPEKEKFIKMMRQYGISDNSQIVLYSTTESNWATRVWWMLRVFGFNNAAILNGGWSKWKAEGRSTSIEECAYAPGEFNSRLRSGLVVSKDEVLTAIGRDDIRIICALPTPMYTGVSDMAFGRKGRIADSVNVPFLDLHDSETGCYLPVEQLHKRFDEVDANTADNIIAYCGAGVAASNSAFVLTLLGYKNVAVYDGSMIEWGNDASLPMEME